MRTRPSSPRRRRTRSASPHVARAAIESLESRRLFAFGVSTGTTPTGQSTYVIDNGGELKFSVIRGGTLSSTIHLGDISSIQFKSREMLATYAVTSRYSHYEQGLGSATAITYTVDNANGWILVKCDDSIASDDSAIQYYAVRRNDNNLYMASLPTNVNGGPGEGRFIAYLSRSVFTTPEEPSDLAGNTGAIEGGDVFGFADGTTASKFYNVGGRRQIEHEYHGLSGNAAGTPVGAWMFMGNREHSAGGPFFRDIDFQAGSAVEIYNCIFTGHTQTESYRQGLHTYALQFSDGSLPVEPDYAWMESLNLQGWIAAAQRGTLTGVASGIAAGHEVTVGLSNATEQYWDVADAAGNFIIEGVRAGTYTQTLYDGELEVGRKTVTIAAGATTNSNIVNTFHLPSNPIFRLGTWDGTPLGFMNADKIEIMHPSDARMTPWTSTSNFVVGMNTDAQWPMTQFMGVNNSQRITFNLTAAQVQNLTLRIGVTLGFEGGRNRITVNDGQTYEWTSAIPSASRDLNSRGITRGTWRGDNQLYTYNIPASALRAGTNTIDLPVVSGSYVAGQTWLSPNVVYDAIDLVPTSAASTPAIASVTVTPANSTVGVNGAKAFAAVARDGAGNIVAANIDWSATDGTIDPNGNYFAPATVGGQTITAAATRTRTPGYSTSASSTSAVGAAVTGAGSTTITVLAATPVVATPAGANPNPAYYGSTALSVLGNDDGGESNLTYTWSVVGTPPSPVSFSANGTNAAKATTATFNAAATGTYNFLVTIADGQGNSVTSGVAVNVRQKVAWYENDVSAGTTLPDSSGNNRDATLGGAYSFVPGVSGNAVKFSGAGGAATLPAGVVSPLTGNFTIATWIKPDSLGAADTWARVFDFGSGSTNYMFLTPRAGVTNLPRFAINTGAGEQQVNSSVALSAGQWNHVAITLAGNTATLYINGIARGSNAAVTLRPSNLGNTTQNYLGDSQFAADPALLASIDDFRIYPRALSLAEMRALAGGAVAGRAFHDVNANNALDPGEATLSGVQVYLDANANGVRDAAELTTTTADAGEYAFENVPAGNYTVREAAAPAEFASANAPAVAVGNATTATRDLGNARVVYHGTGGGEHFAIRGNASGQYEIRIDGTLAYTVFGGAPSLTFNLLGGDDLLTLEFINGPTINCDGGADADELDIALTDAADTVAFNAVNAAGVAHANLESIRFDGNGGWDSVTLNGGPTVTFADAQQFELLTLTGAGAATFALGSGASAARDLDILDTARLDLADSTLIIDTTDPAAAGAWNGSAYTGYQGLVASGYNYSTWDGPGIVTTQPQALLGVTTVAVATAEQVLFIGASETAIYAGQTVTGRSVILKYTYTGDLNLDGVVDGADYGTIDNYVQFPGTDGYVNGDFNFDGLIDGADYGLIDNAVQLQGDPL